MKKIGVFLLLVFCSSFARAQSAEDEIRAVIANLFDGMRSKNIELISGAFDPEALMQTTVVGTDGARVQSNSVQDFLARIGQTPAETQLDERILEYVIQVDGPMAAAWTPYEFYVNDTFSHCGVNSFQLVKKPDGWKIVYIIDTRRKEGCN
ncbi:nuclear transport factor 2 family protein [Algoriphagus namhaensis]